MPDTDFLAANGSFNVVGVFRLGSLMFLNFMSQIRSQFDEFLFKHAQESGCSAHEGYKVKSLDFHHQETDRPIRANFLRPDGSEGSISFDYLVDASGRSGLMSTKYLKNRRMNTSLKKIATWGYWTGGKAYHPGTPKEGAPWFEALVDETGWAWYAPYARYRVRSNFHPY